MGDGCLCSGRGFIVYRRKWAWGNYRRRDVLLASASARLTQCARAPDVRRLCVWGLRVSAVKSRLIWSSLAVHST